MSKKQRKQTSRSSSRHWISIGMFACLFLLLVYKITLFDDEQLGFLREQAEKRSIRYLNVAHRRGDIFDRNEKLLAVSSRVFTTYVDPYYYRNTVGNANIISAVTGVSSQDIIAKVSKGLDKRYVVIRRNLTPASVRKLQAIDIAGLYYEEDFKRFYPASEAAAQITGFTDNEGNGLEGVELAFDDWLHSERGQRKVVVDGRGTVIRDLGIVTEGKTAQDLTLSLDIRIQEMAYASLQKHVRQARAKHGSMIVVDPHDGEILAVVSYPSFNPNNRRNLDYDYVRNRVFTDAIEPGSTIKPLTIVAAFNTGEFDRNTIIDTGTHRIFQIGSHRISDTHKHGKLNIEQLIVKSSNIGAAKIGIQLGAGHLLDMFNKLALGGNTGSYFPGEVDGVLPYGRIHTARLATLSYGYGLKVTLAQLARAYSVIANGGKRIPLTLIRQSTPRFEEQVISPQIAYQVRDIMRLVTRKGGTATRAAIEGYDVAGKTGTVHKFINNRYSRHKYRSLFVGMAPADKPKLVAAVMIDEPGENSYYGGEVAAPVFSEVIGQSLRLTQVALEDRT